jgi:hypothetical protein
LRIGKRNGINEGSIKNKYKYGKGWMVYVDLSGIWCVVGWF